MVSIGGNLYSVPNATRRRPVEVHTTAGEVCILEDARVIAVHPVLEDAPLETQHRLETAGRQRQQMRAFLGKVFGDDAPCGGMHAGVGDIVLPLPDGRAGITAAQ